MQQSLPQMARHIPFVAGVAICLLGTTAQAHEHHMNVVETGEVVSKDPIDSILWTHILVQTFAWGILFPTGMVLGLVRSRWHVPVQILGTCLAILGYFLGHSHKGRQFAPSAHSKFAPWLNFLLATQVILGIYLKLHIERGFLGKIRFVLVRVHGLVGKVMPIASWVQLLFGGIAALGFCWADHLGQCIAHFIMGSTFIAYGIFLLVILLVGQAWMRRTGRSQEFFDSTLIAAWGCVNTFTEHRWGQAWAHNDIQHTSMGVIWWCAGLLGMWLSRTKDGRPRRNIIPAVVIFVTGYAMSAHPQHLMISAKTHSIFGYTLMAAGLTRLIEISFVLKDKQGLSEDGSTDPNSFQYLPPFLLCAGGFMFMGATEEQMKMIDGTGVDHVSYFMLLYSVAFLMFLFANILIHVYAVNAEPKSVKLDAEAGTNGHINGGPRNNLDRDAEEFELHGLASDDEDEDEDGRLLKERRSMTNDT